MGSFPGAQDGNPPVGTGAGHESTSSAGSSPARTSEDFPLPEEPTTARKRVRASLPINCSLCPSRPKKRWLSSNSNGRNPGKGLVGIPISAKFSVLCVITVALLLPCSLAQGMDLAFGD